MNRITLMGRLTRDPELNYNSSTGNPMARFTLAVDRRLSKERKMEMEAKNQPTADFIQVVCWGRLAESVSRYTEKAKRVIVEGRIRTGSYEGKDGTRRYTTDVVASAVEFIDWKDHQDSSQQPNYGSGSPYPENRAVDEEEDSDDFFGDDFSPVDDDRIPF